MHIPESHSVGTNVDKITLEIADANEKHEIDEERSLDASTLSTHIPDQETEKRILRKIDVRLLPILGLLYTICTVDRGNISVARISGLDEDLALNVGNRSSIVLLIFFISYIIVEIPSNMVIKKVGPANWLAGIVFAWGAVSIGIGFLHTWGGLSALRFILGAFEGGFFPGCVYLIGSWYLRYEMQKRLAVFYLIAQGLGGFANILAYGIIQIAKHTAYRGWRWIYIVEGSITCLAGILSWFIIVDFPDSSRNRFLTLEEKEFIQTRLQTEQRSEDATHITGRVVWETTKDWQAWSYTFMYMTGAFGSYVFLFFLPIILQQSLGLSQELSFILAAPPAVFAVIVVYFISWLADRWQTRAPFLILMGVVEIIGLAMTGFLHSPWPRYAGTFLGEAGAHGVVLTSLAWQANNVQGNAKKGVASSYLIMASAVGGILSSVTFEQSDAPRYIKGIVTLMVFCVVTVIVAAVTALVLRRQNARTDEKELSIQGREGFKYTI